MSLPIDPNLIQDFLSLPKLLSNEIILHIGSKIWTQKLFLKSILMIWDHYYPHPIHNLPFILLQLILISFTIIFHLILSLVFIYFNFYLSSSILQETQSFISDYYYYYMSLLWYPYALIPFVHPFDQHVFLFFDYDLKWSLGPLDFTRSLSSDTIYFFLPTWSLTVYSFFFLLSSSLSIILNLFRFLFTTSKKKGFDDIFLFFFRQTGRVLWSVLTHRIIHILLSLLSFFSIFFSFSSCSTSI